MKSLVDHRAHSGQAERGESGVSYGTQWSGLAWGISCNTWHKSVQAEHGSLVYYTAQSGQAECEESGGSHDTQWSGLAWGVWWITGHTVVRLMEEGK